MRTQYTGDRWTENNNSNNDDDNTDDDDGWQWHK